MASSSIGLWLSILGIELAYHNTLYEKYSNNVIDDAYYDKLNKLYFDTCEVEKLATAKGLHRDTGMMTPSGLTTMVRLKNEREMVENVSKLKKDREESVIWKDLTVNSE